ncbi:GNAT family N-acetyltransferase [Streptomyces sp. NPDC006134]|uniref:GNAT family N-acetyltransferase n=1 Tax=Streptomyces sp. NPDC006134 TaxID=3154467 RepID=UPI003403803E
MSPHRPFAVRRPGDVPLDSLVRLVRAHEEHVTGMAARTREDVLLEIARTGHEENAWCLTGPGEEVLAWAALTPRGDTLHATLAVLPGRHGHSTARALLALVLDRADELSEQDGRPYAVAVGDVLSGDPVVPSVLREAGFAPGATAGWYAIDLTVPPLPPLLPDDGAIRPAGPGDLGTLHTLHRRSRTKGAGTEEAAAFHASFERLRGDGGAALLLEVSGRPAGHVLGRVTAGGEGRVLDLAVDPAFRGLGIGYALLTAGLAELRARGAARAQVTLDTDDPYDPEALGRVLAVRSARTVTRFHREAG